MAPRVEPLPPPVPIVPRVTIQLRGIATDVVNGASEHTAIVTTDAGLLLVRQGEMAGEYRVAKIEDEAIELEGPAGTLRLTLASPKAP